MTWVNQDKYSKTQDFYHLHVNKMTSSKISILLEVSSHNGLKIFITVVPSTSLTHLLLRIGKDLRKEKCEHTKITRSLQRLHHKRLIKGKIEILAALLAMCFMSFITVSALLKVTPIKSYHAFILKRWICNCQKNSKVQMTWIKKKLKSQIKRNSLHHSNSHAITGALTYFRFLGQVTLDGDSRMPEVQRDWSLYK